MKKSISSKIYNSNLKENKDIVFWENTNNWAGKVTPVMMIQINNYIFKQVSHNTMETTKTKVLFLHLTQENRNKAMTPAIKTNSSKW